MCYFRFFFVFLIFNFFFHFLRHIFWRKQEWEKVRKHCKTVFLVSCFSPWLQALLCSCVSPVLASTRWQDSGTVPYIFPLSNFLKFHRFWFFLNFDDFRWFPEFLRILHFGSFMYTTRKNADCSVCTVEGKFVLEVSCRTLDYVLFIYAACISPFSGLHARFSSLKAVFFFSWRQAKERKSAHSAIFFPRQIAPKWFFLAILELRPLFDTDFSPSPPVFCV